MLDTVDPAVAGFSEARLERVTQWLAAQVSQDSPIDQTVKQSAPMQVRHLMNHTSGLTYGFMNTTPVDALYRERAIEFQSRKESLADIVTRLAQIPLLCQPGSQWNYSVATDVLGRLVEVWSGMSLADFCEQKIFVPLQMHDTAFWVPEQSQDRFAALYLAAGQSEYPKSCGAD